MSLHVVEALSEGAASWTLTEAPPPAGYAWRHVFPAKGEAPGKVAWVAMSTAGLFRAVVVTGVWLVGLSVSTRIRAGVGLVVVVTVVTVGAIAGNIHR